MTVLLITAITTAVLVLAVALAAGRGPRRVPPARPRRDETDRRRRERHDEHMAAANAHPRTGNVDHLGTYR